jgi:hypothetical protein
MAVVEIEEHIDALAASGRAVPRAFTISRRMSARLFEPSLDG